MNKVLVHCGSFLILLSVIFFLNSCGVYSMKGITTTAETLSIEEFYNNADLGPANMGQDFTNSLKNYFVQNSSLSVVREEGELQFTGEIMNYTLTPIAPTSNNDPNGFNTASSTRLTISIKVTYVDTTNEEMSFKDRSFSFYQDFTNDQNITDIEDALIKKIFDRIINDIFNASVANW